VGCEKYNSMVSMHGRILIKGILDSYYKQPLYVFSHSATVEEDVEVDITGNGCLLFKRNFMMTLILGMILVEQYQWMICMLVILQRKRYSEICVSTSTRRFTT